MHSASRPSLGSRARRDCLRNSVRRPNARSRQPPITRPRRAPPPSRPRAARWAIRATPFHPSVWACRECSRGARARRGVQIAPHVVAVRRVADCGEWRLHAIRKGSLDRHTPAHILATAHRAAARCPDAGTGCQRMLRAVFHFSKGARRPWRLRRSAADRSCVAAPCAAKARWSSSRLTDAGCTSPTVASGRVEDRARSRHRAPPAAAAAPRAIVRRGCCRSCARRRLAARRHQAVPLATRVGAPSGDGVSCSNSRHRARRPRRLSCACCPWACVLHASCSRADRRVRA